MIRMLSRASQVPPVAVVMAALFGTGPVQARQVILVANSAGNSIGAYDANTGATISASFITGLSDPTSLALDSNNHLFVTNLNNYTVGEYNATTGATINANLITLDSLHAPSAIAVDGNNNLLVRTGGYIGKYTTTGDAINATFMQIPSDADPMVLGNNNRLYAVTRGQNIPPLCNVAVYDTVTGASINPNFVPPLLNVDSLLLDGNNHLLVSTYGFDVGGPNDHGGGVIEFDANSGSPTNPAFIPDGHGLYGPEGMVMDGSNHLFVSSFLCNTIGEYDAITGWTINATLVNGQGLNSPGAMVLVPFVSVPEPSSLLLLAAGGAAIRRRRQATYLAPDQ